MGRNSRIVNELKQKKLKNQSKESQQYNKKNEINFHCATLSSSS